MLIGTHRILSQDVELPKLGLVVVDEEQRFGVAHKEALKGSSPPTSRMAPRRQTAAPTRQTDPNRPAAETTGPEAQAELPLTC